MTSHRRWSLQTPLPWWSMTSHGGRSLQTRRGKLPWEKGQRASMMPPAWVLMASGRFLQSIPSSSTPDTVSPNLPLPLSCQNNHGWQSALLTHFSSSSIWILSPSHSCSAPCSNATAGAPVSSLVCLSYPHPLDEIPSKMGPLGEVQATD